MPIHIFFKITQIVSFEFFNFNIYTNFSPIKIDLSGNTAVWPQTEVFQRLAKLAVFGIFNEM